ncbi:hypothetical protein KG089_02200 [Carnobacteriaceae bacterium zg-ZUI252]|nr:hypothetical protein [Carnobacteriaceae bacterium zg-ZUI252]MBS4770610.1 hypothetical protein [Carnobacteriaceae bacterium zg-ZUI240]
MNTISKATDLNQKNTYLETVMIENKGQILNRNDIDCSFNNPLSATNKMQIGFIYLCIPIIVATMIYVMVYSNPLSWLYGLLSGVMVYTLFVYAYPIPLDSVFQEWVITNDNILFSKQQLPSAIMLPFYVMAKKTTAKIELNDIANVYLSSKSNGARMENGFSFGTWSPKMNPFLQNEYHLTIKEKDGAMIELRTKNSDLMLQTIVTFLNAHIAVEIK